MHLSQIIIFPIKSLDGIQVQQVRITSGGILEGDRTYVMLDQEGKYVNGKRHARVHQLRSNFSPDGQEVTLFEEGSTVGQHFFLGETGSLDVWLTSFFGFPVRLECETQSGFPDDREAFGPTLVGEESLAEIARWYPGITVESIRRRFRTNLEICGPNSPPFSEDRLYGAKGVLYPFTVGQVLFYGHNPCQRCAVPTRDPDHGTTASGFQAHFMNKRQEFLPPWAEATRFNHYYRFAVNTSIPPSQTGKTLRLGDLIDSSPNSPA